MMGDMDSIQETAEPTPTIELVLAVWKTSQDALEELMLKLRRCGIQGQPEMIVELARITTGSVASELRTAQCTIAGLAGKVDRG